MAEHLKYGGDVLADYLTSVVNDNYYGTQGKVCTVKGL